MLVLLLTVSVVFLTSDAVAQTPPIWGDLEPGPYVAGFKTAEVYDYSRTFGRKFDYFGNPLPEQTTRRIQLCVWYPAQDTVGALPMVYGEYAYPYPEDDRFVNLLSALQTREAYALIYLLNTNYVLALDMMSVEMAAVRDAQPAEGPFPLIIYHPHLRNSFAENAVMCEYLATYGFVVATTHSVGTHELNSEVNLVDLETLTRDKEFVLAHVRAYPFVDANRLGVMGYGWGGVTSLIMQMRNSDVMAVATFQGAFLWTDHLDLIRGIPQLAIERMYVPWLQMYAPIEPPPDLALMDTCVYAPRYAARFSGLRREDFTIYGMISEHREDSANAYLEIASHGGEIICRYVKTFFRAYLNGDEESRRFLDNSPADNGIDPELLSLAFHASRRLPPTETQFVSIIRDVGVAKAMEIYEEFKASDPDHMIFRESVLNSLGYQLVRTQRTDEAQEVFRLNTEAYPHSANTWDSYGEVCVANGDEATALQCARKVLEVLAVDTTTSDQVKEIIRNNANQILERSQQQSPEGE